MFNVLFPSSQAANVAVVLERMGYNISTVGLDQRNPETKGRLCFTVAIPDDKEIEVMKILNCFEGLQFVPVT